MPDFTINRCHDDLIETLNAPEFQMKSFLPVIISDSFPINFFSIFVLSKKI